VGPLALAQQHRRSRRRGLPLSAPEADDDWIARLRRLRDDARPGGTLDYLGTDARLRGVAEVRSGTTVNLARPLVSEPGSRFQLQTSFDERGRLTVGFDRLEVQQHGVGHTHLDAWNHYAVDGTFFPGVPVAEADRASVAAWAEQGVLARAVLLDVPAVRDVAWVDDEPVSGDELEQALAAAGGDLEPGDAVLVYAGRDRFEAAGHTYRTVPETKAAGLGRPGLGRSAAEWVAERRVSLVCWDFLDAIHPDEPHGPVHLLVWAVGLGLVDNCDLGKARDALRAEGRHSAMLVLAPLLMPGATASLVSPLLVL
jgi:kynurenine formamidase